MQIAKHWRLQAQRYRLEGARNLQTGATLFPPPSDMQGYEPVTLSGRGVIESWTSVGRVADGFEDGLLLALVRLEEGPLLTAQLADIESDGVSIGMPVEMVTRRLRALGPDGLLVYGYKFRPLLAAQEPGMV